MRDGKLFSLQHKTKTPVPIGEWLEAEIKTGRDGSGDRYYRVGFHSVPTVEDAQSYLKHFRPARRARLKIVEVEVSETWSKEHSPAPVILSRFLKVNQVLEVE
jgi:hypothetical protein